MSDAPAGVFAEIPAGGWALGVQPSIRSYPGGRSEPMNSRRRLQRRLDWDDKMRPRDCPDGALLPAAHGRGRPPDPHLEQPARRCAEGLRTPTSARIAPAVS